MEKQLKDFTDLELGKAQGQLYQEFIRIQGNLIAVNQEITRREPTVEMKVDTSEKVL